MYKYVNPIAALKTIANMLQEEFEAIQDTVRKRQRQFTDIFEKNGTKEVKADFQEETKRLLDKAQILDDIITTTVANIIRLESL